MKTNVILAICIFMLANGACKNNQDSGKQETIVDPGVAKTGSAPTEVANKDDSNNIFKISMEEMITALSSMEMTGDYDVDYLKIMLVLRQGEIELSRMEIQKGTDPQLRETANIMLLSQQDDQTKLWEQLKKSQPKTSRLNSNALHAALGPMINKMQKVELSDQIDMDFVTMSILLHQGALNIHKKEIANGRIFEHIQIAVAGKEMDEDDIEILEAWLELNNY